MGRCVAHLDMDAFYVSVVVSGSGPRAVVTTASYEARRFGVRSAIPASRARRLCPDAVWVAPDFPAYREESRRVMGLVRAHVERVEVMGLDEAYLDLTGLSAPRAAMRRLVAVIAEATGLGASVGIGPNRLVAKVASDAEKPRGFVVLSREQACARWADAPPGMIPGIGPKTATRLAELGLSTLTALRSAEPERLSSAFGPRLGPWLRHRAAFADDTPVGGEREAVSESRETTFPSDLRDPTELEGVLERLAGELCAGLRRNGRRGRTVGIKVRLDDFSTHTRARTLSEPLDDPVRVGALARELLRQFAPTRPVRLLGVRVAGLERGADPQLALPL